ESMQTAIDETNRRRRIQMDYNKAHGIEPKTVLKSKEAILGQTKVADSKKTGKKYYVEQDIPTIAADPLMQYLDKNQLKHLIDQTRKKMEQAARDLDFMEAARLRDELFELEKKYGKDVNQ
ncbi:MAG: UvrB/UvrC motif-containing protein, partial [Cyclobacteriaceae bacterium]|nr:UvrB/UvrC motif-containing protein [Cyclobacteriaceae bacterium]